MKKIWKFTALVLTLILFVSALCVIAFAENGAEELPEEDAPVVEMPEEDAELVSGAVFEIIAANGKRRGSGVTDVEFKEALLNYYDGDTVILLDDLHIVPRDTNGEEVFDTTKRPDPSDDYSWAFPVIYREDGATVNIDLNGHGVNLRDDDWMGDGRQTQSVFIIRGNSVVNFYSSQPGGYVFASSTLMSSSNYYTGGFAFSISDTSVVNIGRFEKPDGTVASGSNLSTSAPGFINCPGGKAEINVDGGTYYRFRTGSQVGLIAQREPSETRIYIKNANLICYGMGGSYMIRGPKSETIFENCLIYNVYTDKATMVSNQGGGVGTNEYYRFTGRLILKDCVTNYNLSYISKWPLLSNSYTGQLWLEGETAFRKENYTEDLRKSMEEYKDGFIQNDGEFEIAYKGINEAGTVLARVPRKLEVEGNPISYIPGYGDPGFNPLPEFVIGESASGDELEAYRQKLEEYHDIIETRLALLSMNPNPNFEAYAFVPEENTVNCKFVDAAGTAFEYVYKDGVDFVPPSSITFPTDEIKGIFKYGWKETRPDEKNVRIEVAPFADFDVRISYDLYSDFALNIFVPKDVYNVYVDPVGSMINGNPIISGSEKEVTLKVDGEDVVYYCFKVKGLSPADVLQPISFSMPLNFWSEKHNKRIQGDGSWQADILSYSDRIMAENSGCSDAEKQMMNDLLHYVKTCYLETVSEEELNAELIAKLDERINTAALTVNGETLSGAVSAVKADTLNLPDYITATVDKRQGKLNLKAGGSYSGEVRIYVGGCVDIYTVKPGDEINLHIPASYLFEGVKIKLFDGEGNLIPSADSADASSGISGSISFIDTAYAENEALKAFYAYAYSAKLANEG